jgi:acyl transferase domain-containing protein
MRVVSFRLDYQYTSHSNQAKNVTDELLESKESSKINILKLNQALCTAIQVALVDLLRSFGLFPVVVVGHSSGEIAAA